MLWGIPENHSYLVVEVAGDVNGGEFHESVDFFFGESSGLTGEGFDQLRGVDLASSSGVQDLESCETHQYRS